MKFIAAALVLTNCLNMITPSKLYLSLPKDENSFENRDDILQSDDSPNQPTATDALGTREINDFVYTHRNGHPVSDFISRILQAPLAYPITAYHNNYGYGYYPEQWYTNSGNNIHPGYYNGKQNGWNQPIITKKLTTVLSNGDQEIKHKLIVSPDNPNGTGYLSIRKATPKTTRNWSSRDNVTYHAY